MRRFASVVRAAAERFRLDQGFLLASALSFAFLLCLAPFALILFSIAGFLLESEDIAEQHRDVLEASGNDPVGGLELGNRRSGQDGVQQPVRALPLPLDLGHKTYWPVYAEAERLGCALGVHGGAHHGMGLDTFETFVPIHGLGHPLSLIIAFTGMVYHGVFDRFPKLRLGFLEGGAGWVTFWMDRLDRSHSYHIELNLRGKYQGPSPDRRPSDYIKNGQVFIGCEGNEEGLPYQIERAGNQHFLFASDFPHEIGPDDILHEIEEIDEAPLSDQDKKAVLRENAKCFYGI